MNPSTALATVLVDELVRGGVRHAVLSPGSRSAPLAFALWEADRAGRLRLHVRIDERSAGFLALGLAKGSAAPVAIATTSGTAMANLHPAVLEAHHSGVPMVVLSADRPPELRDTGANQTIDQIKLFGEAVRLFHEVGAPERRTGQVPYWRALVARGLAAATGALDGDPGPVHLNLAFREPLVPDAAAEWLEDLSGRADGGPWTGVGEVADQGGSARSTPTLAPPAGGRRISMAVAAVPERAAEPRLRLSQGPRTVVLAGDGAGWNARWLAEAAGWPLLAEPTSGARSGPNAIGTYRLILGAGPRHTSDAAEGQPSPLGLAGEIERVIVFGRPTLSRPVTRLLSRDDVEIIVVAGSPRWPDVGRRAARVVGAVALDLDDAGAGDSARPGDSARSGDSARPGDSAVSGNQPGEWLLRWLAADAAARKVVDAVLAEVPLSGPTVAQAVAGALLPGGLLFVGSSSPIRDLDLAAPWDDPLLNPQGELDASRLRVVLGNRGVAGIDGTVSASIGAALAVAGEGGRRPPSYALMGDLTFLHDSNGLLIGPDDPRPHLCIVVMNDDGGSIFSVLEQGSPEFRGAFERVFGTPHGVDLAALCAATGTSYERVDDLATLAYALQPRPGLRVVDVRLIRASRRDLHLQLTEAVSRALETG